PLALVRDPQFKFSMNLRVLGAKSLHSKTHDVTFNDNIVKINDVIPDRDLILNILTAQKPSTSLNVHTYKDGDYLYFAVLASPPEEIEEKDIKKLSFIELIDHSGSMGSPRTENSKWSISDFIAKLTYFEIKDMASAVYFGVFDTNTWWEKINDIPQLESFLSQNYGGGGTHLGKAIEQAIHKHKKKGLPYNIVITDAQVSDIGRLLQLADNIYEKGQRFIIICVDSSPNAYIPIEMARRSRGLAFFLRSNLERDMINCVEEISRYWRDPIGKVQVEVTADGDKNIGLEHSQALHFENVLDIGDLTKNMSRWAVGRIKCSNKSSVLFKLMLDGKGTDSVKIDLNKVENVSAVRDIFGVHRINYLEALSKQHYGTPNITNILAKMGYEMETKEKQSIIYRENQVIVNREFFNGLIKDVSLEYGIISGETAFIAVLEREGKVSESTLVPNAIPRGWSNQGPPGLPAGPPSMAGAPPPPGVAPGGPPSGPPKSARLSRSQGLSNFSGDIMKELSSLFSGRKKGKKGGSSHRYQPKYSMDSSVSRHEKKEQPPIFEGTTKKGIFYSSDKTIRLSSLEVVGDVPDEAILSIYLEGQSTPITEIKLKKVKLLGKRPLNIRGMVKFECNVAGIKIILR
ncbi:MAG: VWA domain-containing protein, partial [Candidatus Lokiarchaeota archaeon]|nr:VWA domain-containing protein [Candidatus Lokiarchaeota archaeon]